MGYSINVKHQGTKTQREYKGYRGLLCAFVFNFFSGFMEKVSKFCVEDWLRCGTIFSVGEDRIILGWGKRTWLPSLPAPTPSSKLAFYLPDYFLETPTPWYEHEYSQEISIQDLLALLSSLPPDSPPLHHRWQPPHRGCFNQTFHALQQEITAGNLVKAVPFVTESASALMSAAQLLKSLISALHYLQAHPSRTYIYGFWDSTQGILGVSPEILFQNDGTGHLTTMACAGTKSVQEEAEALLADPKEAHEHALVVEGIVNSLRAYGTVVLGNRQVLKLSHLMHLITPITVQLRDTLPFEKVVKELHPTPAVGAFPRKEGSLWLKEYEKKMPRGRFAAPAGYQTSDGKISRCYVAIRNVQWTYEKMWIAAGCGVVRESHCDREWAEVNLKLKAIKEMLAL